MDRRAQALIYIHKVVAMAAACVPNNLQHPYLVSSSCHLIVLSHLGGGRDCHFLSSLVAVADLVAVILLKAAMILLTACEKLDRNEEQEV
jgi:hypothetical protein